MGETTNLDGRLWRTLALLFLKPGRLTREFLDGRRACQLPPLRLFLIAVLALFTFGQVTEAVGLDVGKAIDLSSGQMGVAVEAPGATASPPGLRITLDDERLDHWFAARIPLLSTHRAEFIATIETWLPRMPLILLPLTALMLGPLYLFRRRIVLYDHFIFAMHSLALMALVLLAVLVLQPAVGGVAAWLLLILPVNLFRHLRGTYDSGVAGALVRMSVLFFGAVSALGALSFGLVALGLASLPAS